MSDVGTKLRLPFSFAKRHGVLLLSGPSATANAVLFKAGVEPADEHLHAGPDGVGERT